MAESLFTSQTPGTANVFENQNVTLATTLVFATAGSVTHCRFYAPTTVTGTFEAALWRVDTDDNPTATGTGTLLGTATFGALTPAAWNTVAFSPSIAVTTGTAYRISVRTSQGRYAATGGFWNSAGLTNGNITGIQTNTDPVGIGTLHNGTFIESISTYPNKTFNGGCYFVDVVADFGVHDLTAADASHAHAGDQPTLTQAHELAAADAVHGHTAEQPSLTQVHAISVDSADHAHSADQPAITQTHLLAPADASHGHTADQPTVTQTHSLLADDTTHTQTAGAPTLTQVHAITAVDAAHVHTAEQPTLSGTNVLSANDASHSHTAENAGLAQVHLLAAFDALHGHLAEPASLAQLHQLAADDAHHALTSDTGTVRPPVVPGILRGGATRPRLTAGRLPRDQ